MTWDKTRFDRFYDFKGEKHGHWNGRPGIRLHYHDWSVGQYQRGVYAPMLKQALGINPGDNVVLVGSAFNWTGEGLSAFNIDVVGTELSDYIDAEKGNTEEAELRALCAAVGVDPENDGIICDENHPLAVFKEEPERVPEIEHWRNDPNEAESRAMWESVHGPLSNYTSLELSREWKLNPLDIWLRGGLANPQPRGYGKILAEDMRNRGSRNSVFGQARGNPRFIISEEVLNSISDTEALELCVNMNDLASERGGTCVHMLSPRRWDFIGEENENPADFLNDDAKWAIVNKQIINADLNWRTYAEWRAFLDASGFADHRIVMTVTAIRQGMVAPSGDIVADRVRPQIEERLLASGMNAAAAAVIAAEKATAFGQWHEAVERVDRYEVM